jgi:hypothetical protein
MRTGVLHGPPGVGAEDGGVVAVDIRWAFGHGGSSTECFDSCGLEAPLEMLSVVVLTRRNSKYPLLLSSICCSLKLPFSVEAEKL